MRLEATVQEIAALLRLADLDAQAPSLRPEVYRSRRERAREQAPRALVERYQTLLEAGRQPAIVAIDGGGCSGCHVRLPTMLEYQVRHRLAVHTCPRCRRMLYAPELLIEQNSPRTGSEKGAAPHRGAPAVPGGRS